MTDLAPPDTGIRPPQLEVRLDPQLDDDDRRAAANAQIDAYAVNVDPGDRFEVWYGGVTTDDTFDVLEVGPDHELVTLPPYDDAEAWAARS